MPTPSRGNTQTQALLATFLAPSIEVLPFEAEGAAGAGSKRAAPDAQGTPTRRADIRINAQVRLRGAALVTLSRRDSGRVPGLIVTDWADRMSHSVAQPIYRNLPDFLEIRIFLNP